MHAHCASGEQCRAQFRSHAHNGVDIKINFIKGEEHLGLNFLPMQLTSILTPFTQNCSDNKKKQHDRTTRACMTYLKSHMTHNSIIPPHLILYQKLNFDIHRFADRDMLKKCLAVTDMHCTAPADFLSD